jgi:hypothetical protein
MSEEDPTTQELRVEQFQLEAKERERAETSTEDDEAEQHERRAEKAGYLREKLEERAKAEREAGASDHEG